MDQPMWLLMDSLRQDYPVWGDRYKLFLSDGRRIGIADDPSSLGFRNGQQVFVRLVLLHLPNAGDGYRLIQKSLSWNEEEKEAMQHATVAAAMAQVADVKEAEQEDASTEID